MDVLNLKEKLTYLALLDESSRIDQIQSNFDNLCYETTDSEEEAGDRVTIKFIVPLRNSYLRQAYH